MKKFYKLDAIDMTFAVIFTVIVLFMFLMFATVSSREAETYAARVQQLQREIAVVDPEMGQGIMLRASKTNSRIIFVQNRRKTRLGRILYSSKWDDLELIDLDSTH